MRIRSHRPDVETLEDRRLLAGNMMTSTMPTMSSNMPMMSSMMMPMMMPQPNLVALAGTLDLAVAVSGLAVRLGNTHPGSKGLGNLLRTEMQLENGVQFVVQNVTPDSAQSQNALNLLQQANNIMVQEAMALANGHTPSSTLRMEAQALQMMIQMADTQADTP
jgi:hypothetical protein